MIGNIARAARVTGAVLAGVAFLAAAIPARADDAVFTVGNYPVQAQADNAVAAKTQALADGQQAAFRSLLKRLVPVTAYPAVRKINVKAGDLIAGYRVRSERNSATEYIASYDFAFQAEAVRNVLRREGIPFTDQQAPAVTLVAVRRAAPTAVPAEDPSWSNIWKGLDLERALTPVKLQPLRKEIEPTTINALTGGDGTAIRSLAGAYRSEHVVVVLAELDPAAKRLNVYLSGRDAVGAFNHKSTYRVDPTDPGYTTELAAVVALGILEGRWKATRVRSTGVGVTAARPSSGGDGSYGGGSSTFSGGRGGATDLMLAVEFRGMSEWQDISRKLAATPGVQGLDVAGLSARGARVTLRYPGGAERLVDALAQQGLSLRNVGGNWVVAAQ